MVDNELLRALTELIAPHADDSPAAVLAVCRRLLVDPTLTINTITRYEVRTVRNLSNKNPAAFRRDVSAAYRDFKEIGLGQLKLPGME